MIKINNSGPCPCDSGLSYAECCSALHSGEQAAASPEQLMRSRYSAFALGNATYLNDTWHPETRPASLVIDPDQRWIGLKIKSVSGSGKGQNTGSVEFVARFKVQGKAYRIHEDSRFTRLGGRWYYLDGKQS